jgi:hypothetical protein
MGTLSFFTMPSPAMLKGLLQGILRDFLIAAKAVSDINVVQIATALASLLGSPGLSLNRKPRSTMGAEGRFRKVLEMAPRAGEVDVETGPAPFTKL